MEIKIPPYPLDISYHEDEDILVIEGVHYSGEIFRTLSMPALGRVYAFERTKELPETVIVHYFSDIEAVKEYMDGH